MQFHPNPVKDQNACHTSSLMYYPFRRGLGYSVVYSSLLPSTAFNSPAIGCDHVDQISPNGLRASGRWPPSIAVGGTPWHNGEVRLQTP